MQNKINPFIPSSERLDVAAKLAQATDAPSSLKAIVDLHRGDVDFCKDGKENKDGKDGKDKDKEGKDFGEGYSLRGGRASVMRAGHSQAEVAAISAQQLGRCPIIV